MRIKTLVALYFWILEFDDVTCIRSIHYCCMNNSIQLLATDKISMKMINIYQFPYVVCNMLTVWKIDRHATAAITAHSDNQCYASLF